MIKKSGAFALTILYTVTMMGFALNLHYCFNRVMSVKINAQVKSCNLLTKMKCCKDKHFEVKVKDVHQAQSQTSLRQILWVQSPVLYFTDYPAFEQQILTEQYLGKDPPDLLTNNPPSFLKNCTFLI